MAAAPIAVRWAAPPFAVRAAQRPFGAPTGERRLAARMAGPPIARQLQPITAGPTIVVVPITVGPRLSRRASALVSRLVSPSALSLVRQLHPRPTPLQATTITLRLITARTARPTITVPPDRPNPHSH